jgi:predicted RNA-binding protein with PUA-like domain
MAHWLLKTEPGAYAFADLVREGRTAWTGVKNPAAQKHLRAMQAGDEVLVYHTGDEKAAVGVARVARAAHPDPTSPGGKLACVDLEPGAALASPVTLASLKAHPAFAGSPLVSQGRLSVVPVTPAQWKVVLALAAR